MFRSGLELALYIAQDRPDIQLSLKTLSAYMAGGTKLAYTALRHLGSYLQGTQDAGVLLTQLKRFGVTSDHWSNREDRKNYNLEVFTDANWAGCKVSRKSHFPVQSPNFMQAAVALQRCYMLDPY